MCIDSLSLEKSKGGYENVLVITDHFTRYAQAFPTRNQTAKTTARVLYENFIVDQTQQNTFLYILSSIYPRFIRF